jgi:exopolysaccharide biosynthesis polyprenyl glycosylphosphotransferase
VQGAHTAPSEATVDTPPTPQPPSTARRGGRSIEAGIMVVGDLLAVIPLALLLDPVFVTGTAAIAGVTLKVKGLYNHRIALSVLDDLPSLAAAVLLAVAPSALLVPLSGHSMGARTIAFTVVCILFALTVVRGVAYGLILRLRQRGKIDHPTLVLGSGGGTAALAHRIEDHPECGLRVVGTLADDASRAPRGLALLGGSRDLAQTLRRYGVTDLVIGYGGISSAAVVEILRTCDRADVEIYVVPRLFELHAMRGGDDHIWGLPLVRIRRPAQRVSTWRVKRAFDIVVAAAILAVLSPVLAAVAAAVRLELGRPLFFRQVRIGLNGQPFELLKFRSMPAAPPGAERGWTVPAEQIGRVGTVIRRYSLDELPQLINVLRGDMSLVGPRPERPEYVEQFCARIPRYVHRHRVPVGMTGLAAVKGLRGDTSIEDRAQFDNWYIDSWSLWLDIKVMLRTLQSVMRGTGA